MHSTKVTRSGRRLIQLAVLDAVAATVAAANLTLTYVFFVVDHPGINVASFVPIMAIGSVPFLITAGLLAWVIIGAGSTAVQLPQHVIGRLRVITGFGLFFMILGGLWSGLAGALLGLEQGTAEGIALTLYQFTFLAAVFIDTITLVVALRTRTAQQ